MLISRILLEKEGVVIDKLLDDCVEV